MLADLVSVTTSDDIRLDGAFLEPERARADAFCDAILFVHGSSGNFYRGLSGTPAQLQAAGYPVVSFNTTAHDLVWGRPGAFFGNAFEILDRCRLDLDAAIGWLQERGFKRIAISGVSMGAVRVIYYQAKTQDERVCAVIPISPVRLSYSYFMRSEMANDFQRYYNKAQKLMDAGEPDALFPVTFPIPHLFSARAYLDKHNVDERYNVMRYVDQVRRPLFLAAGSLETHPRLRDCARDAYALVKDDPANRLWIMEGADHGFPGKAPELAAEILSWLASLSAVPARP